MNPLLILKWWREFSIGALAVLFLSAAHSCSSAKEEVARIKAEDSALAENQRRQNEQKARSDKKAYEDSLNEVQEQLAHLRDDTRVAHLVCPRTSSPRPVSVKTESAARAPADARAELPRTPAPDIGPALDAVTRECDDLAVRHTALVNWLNATH